jgi:hypothetical protein
MGFMGHTIRLHPEERPLGRVSNGWTREPKPSKFSHRVHNVMT